MIGTTVSHYRVLERLGTGGMGDVYLAEDLRLHRPVALKVLRACEECEEDERAQLLREARIASSLNHPHIAVVYDVDETVVDGVRHSLLAMEYVPGRTLAELAADRPLTFDEILDLAGQAAEALAEAHARGVVHRDVKPSNLMVDRDGSCWIIDFGLAGVIRSGEVRPQPAIEPPSEPPADVARTGEVEATRSTVVSGVRTGEAVHSVNSLRLTGGPMGTPPYMAPEQFEGEPVPASDVEARIRDLISLSPALKDRLKAALNEA